MCLSITVTATRDVNRTRFKRVLDCATFMSVYSNDRGVSGVFYNETASESVEMDLFVEHLRGLKSGRPIEQPVYDFTRHVRTDETTLIEPRDVIIAEGILLFHAPEIRDCLDIKIFVDTPADIRLLRRITRDIRDRGRTLESVTEQYVRTVRPMHEEFVEPSKRYADVIIPEGGYNEIAIDMVSSRIRLMQEVFG